MSAEARLLGRFLLLLAGLNLVLAALLNARVLSFLYADGRLVSDMVSNIQTVQLGFAFVALALAALGALLRRARLGPTALNATLALVCALYIPVLAELLLSLSRRPGVYGAWDPFGLCRTTIALGAIQQRGHRGFGRHASGALGRAGCNGERRVQHDRGGAGAGLAARVVAPVAPLPRIAAATHVACRRDAVVRSQSA